MLWYLEQTITKRISNQISEVAYTQEIFNKIQRGFYYTRIKKKNIIISIGKKKKKFDKTQNIS